MTLDELPAVFTAARWLWPHDRDIARKSDEDEVGMARAWHRHLSPYSVDETTAAMDSVLASTSTTRCPSLGVLVGEIRAIRHRSQPEQPATPPAKDGPVHPSANPYREKLRADLVRFHRRADGTISADKLREIDEEVAWVGPREAAFLAKHGIDVPVTMPQRRGGNLLAPEAEVAPSLDDQAARWLDDWRGADAEQREQMRAATLSDEMKAAIKRLQAQPQEAAS